MRIKIDQRGGGEYGEKQYWYCRIDATIDERASCGDAVDLMAHTMITGVGPMLAGDFVRVLVWNHKGEFCGSYRGRPQYRDDKALRELADSRRDEFTRARPA